MIRAVGYGVAAYLLRWLLLPFVFSIIDLTRLPSPGGR